jgi:hypothetical protein
MIDTYAAHVNCSSHRKFRSHCCYRNRCSNMAH